MKLVINRLDFSKMDTNKIHAVFPIIGHEKTIQLLLREVETGSISHAYLFAGRDQIGKRQVALKFVQALFCVQAPHIGCGVCPSCEQVAKQVHPDLHVVTPEEGKTSISIDAIRKLQATLTLTPYSAPYSIALIDSAHLLQKPAANALLKTLEEPSSKKILILITPVPQRLPTTILSRSRIIRFITPKRDDILQGFYRYFDRSLPEKMVQYAHGRVGWIYQMLENPDEFQSIVDFMQQCTTIVVKPLHERVLISKKILEKKDRDVLGIYMTQFLYWLREESLQALGDIGRGDKHMVVRYLQKALLVSSDFVYTTNRRMLMEQLWLSYPK